MKTNCFLVSCSFAVLCYSLHVIASEFDTDKAIDDCISLAAELQPIFNEAELESREYCERNVTAKIEWVNSGSLVVYLDRSGCTYQGEKTNKIINCLPESFPENVKAIKIVATQDTSAAYLIETMELLRARGVERILMAGFDESIQSEADDVATE